MTSVKSRLERLEKEQRFQRWIEISNIFGRFTDDELKTYTETGELPESVLCASYADRPSRLDGLDRKTLLQMWEEQELLFGGRSDCREITPGKSASIRFGRLPVCTIRSSRIALRQESKRSRDLAT